MTIEEIRSWIQANFRDDNMDHWYLPGSFKHAIQPILPSELEVIELPPNPKERFNCFVFALDLHKDPDFWIRPNILGNGTAIERLIQEGILLQTNKPTLGDYVVYRNDHKITHMGIVGDDNKIISKWSDGPIIKHDLLAVQPSYGKNISYYKKVAREQIKEFLQTLS